MPIAGPLLHRFLEKPHPLIGNKNSQDCCIVYADYLLRKKISWRTEKTFSKGKDSVPKLNSATRPARGAA
jgi:hypothetical protein